LKNRLFLLLLSFSLSSYIASCANSEFKSIKNPKEVDVIVIVDGIAVNDIELNKVVQKKVIDWHNNAHFMSEVENKQVETFAQVEELSNSSIDIYINTNWIVRMMYQKDNIFRVIHELEDKKRAYYINSPELLGFIKEKQKDK
jgi:hypothetical protein